MFDSNYNANTIPPSHQAINNHPFDDLDLHLLNTFQHHFLDDNEMLHDNILPYHLSPPQLPPAPAPPATNKDLTGERKAARRGGGSKSRKTGKKDRHSKIHTAQGPRDRRMRLSLQIARKFFDLQDMLGFDKASKTIEWLFNKSKAAIKDLAVKNSHTNLIPSFALLEGDFNDEENETEKINKKGKKRIEILSEKRKEARARARERTLEKLKMQKQGKKKTFDFIKEGLERMEGNPNRSNNEIFSQISPLSSKNLMKQRPLEDQMASVGIIEKFLIGSSSMADFGDDCEDGFTMGFPENNGFTEIGRINNNDNGNYGIISSNVEGMNSEYNYQVQGPNCAFMGRAFNHGY